MTPAPCAVAGASFARRRWRFSLVATLVAATPVPLSSQQDGRAAEGGAVVGVAFDSLRRAPMAGGFAWVNGTEAASTSDANGQFRIEGIPPGEYALSFSHPSLDSLGLPDLAAAVRVMPGATARVRLASPPMATLREQLCDAGSTFDTEGGIVFGTLRSARTRALLAGARVSVEWLVLAQNAQGVLEGQVATAIVQSDSLGIYRVCGVPQRHPLTIRGHSVDAATEAIEISLDDLPIARRDLIIGVPSVVSGQVAQDAVTDVGTAAAIGSSSVVGIVVSEGGVPLGEALVMLPSVKVEARTGEDGSFRLQGIPAGSRMLEIRLPGYVPQNLAVNLHGGDTAHVRVTMSPISTLAPVRVRGERVARDVQELAQRQRMGFGYHYSSQELQARATLRSVFESTPSMRTQAGRNPGEYMLLMRAPRGYCVPTLYLDGLRVDARQLDAYRPEEFFAIEVYPRGSGAPVRYLTDMREGDAPCGVILAWTKYYIAAQ